MKIRMLLTLSALLAPCFAASPVAGDWQGNLLGRVRLNLHVQENDDGSLRGTLNSPDQGNITIPIEALRFDNGTVRAELKSIGAAFEGKLDAAGAEISGTWQQGPNTLPLVFRRPGAAPQFTLKAVTRGRVALEPCRTPDANTEGLCGKYEVWENRTTRQGRKIALNLMVLPALAEKPAPDPVFALAGGPGEAAVTTYPSAGYIGKLRRERDVVLVDQRGTGQSNPLPCDVGDTNDPQVLVAGLFAFDYVAACRAQLEKRADLTQYTTSIFADDLDEVRAALGYGKIDLLGGSYGTKAALVYLRLHGDQVRSVVLKGVAPPQYKVPLPFAKTIQAAVDRLIDDCAADAVCGKSYPNLKAEFAAVLDRLAKTPAQFTLPHASTGKPQTVTMPRSAFVANLRTVLYVPALASQLPYMIHRAFDNDWAAYGAGVFTINRSVGDAIARGLSLSAVCTEDVAALTEPEIRRETDGTYLGDFQVRAYQKACGQWPHGSVPKDYYAPVRSDVPTLLIAGAQDPATPPAMAEEAARGLSHSRVVTMAQGTHLTTSPCIDDLVAAFVSRGSAEGLDASCTEQIRRPPFVTPEQMDAARRRK